MEAEKTSAGALRMFKAWVQNQFDKQAEYSPIVSVSESFRRVLPTESAKLRWGFPDKEDWVVPVKFNGSTLGQVKIKDGSGLNEPTLLRIAHYIDLGLAPALFRHHVEVKLNNIQATIQTREARLENVEMMSPGQLETFISSPSSTDTSSLTPALIELVGQESFRFRKIAFEIRNRYSNLFAFIDLKDMASEITCAEDIWSLHNVCLFSDRLLQKDHRLMKIVSEYFDQVSQNPDRERPLLILADVNNEALESMFPSTLLTNRKRLNIDRWPLRAEDLTKVLDLILE